MMEIEGEEVSVIGEEVSLEDRVIMAAKYAEDTGILTDLVRGVGEASSLTENARQAMILDAIYLAALSEHKESLVVLLDEGRTDISGLSDYFCYLDIERLKSEVELSGTEQIDQDADF